MENYKWCIIRDYKHIRFSNIRPWCRPAYDTLLMDPKYEVHENGVLEITGQEIVYHFISNFLGDSNRLEDLDFSPDISYIKKKTIGFFHKEEIQYVEDGWVKDSKTMPYHGIFNNYDCEFDQNS